MATITHAQISAATAGKIGKTVTAELVSNVVTEYANTVTALASEKLPTNGKEPTLIQTPFAALKVNRHESGIKKNADGSETKVGVNYTVNVAFPKAFLKGINVNAAAEIVSTILGGSKAKIA